MMDLSTIDPALIVARGEYASVNGAYKTLMEDMQKKTQEACDRLRLALQDETQRDAHITRAEMLVGMLASMVSTADELREQKDALKVIAWGDK
jgi:hypothetical protein